MEKLVDIYSERALLAAVFYNPVIIESIDLTEEDFTDMAHRAIFSAMLEVKSEGKEIDEYIIGSKVLGTIAEKALTKIEPVTAANYQYYVENVKECSRKRELAQLGKVIASMTDSSSEEITAYIEEVLEKLQDGETSALRNIQELTAPMIQDIQEKINTRGTLTGLSTGYRSIDYILDGFRPGEFIVIAARPSMGKTALMLSMILRIAKEKNTVGVFSCEMSQRQLMRRAVSTEGRINSRNVSSGFMRVDEINSALDAAQHIHGMSVIIDDTPNIKLNLLKNRARRMKRRGTQIIFVDYLTLIKHPNSTIPMWERVGEISKDMKELARELDIPIVALSQVTRIDEDKMPTLACLRMSGAIEEDADVIMFLWRNRAKCESQEDMTTVIDIAKNREGSTGKAELIFVPQYVTFEEKEYHD
jgi:replicative DNA helicase